MTIETILFNTFSNYLQFIRFRAFAVKNQMDYYYARSGTESFANNISARKQVSSCNATLPKFLIEHHRHSSS